MTRHVRPSGVYQNLPDHQREILLEAPQGGRALAYQGVRGFPEEQGRDEPSRRFIAAPSHTRGEMGEHFDGLHHRVAHGAGQGLHIRSR